MKAHFQLYTIKDKFYEGQAGDDELIGRWGETQEETEGHLNKRQKGKKKKKKTKQKDSDKKTKAAKNNKADLLRIPLVMFRSLYLNMKPMFNMI